jgi:hypothetical protein
MWGGGGKPGVTPGQCVLRCGHSIGSHTTFFLLHFSVLFRFALLISLRSFSFRSWFLVFRFEAKQAKNCIFSLRSEKFFASFSLRFASNRKRTAHPSFPPQFSRNQKFCFRENFRESFVFSYRIFRENEKWISRKLSRKNESENFRPNPSRELDSPKFADLRGKVLPAFSVWTIETKGNISYFLAIGNFVGYFCPWICQLGTKRLGTGFGVQIRIYIATSTCFIWSETKANYNHISNNAPFLWQWAGVISNIGKNEYFKYRSFLQNSYFKRSKKKWPVVQ